MMSMHVLNAQDMRSVTVTGQCYLEGETDHSDTKILFNPASGSAVTDSVYTASDGSYVAGLSEGIYFVSYSHDGFIPVTLPGELIFFEDTELEELTLASGSAQELSGTLLSNQNWTNEFEYWIIGDIYLNQGDTLTIGPGVNVLFMGQYEFIIDGVLYAIGTVEDSIRFTSGQPVKNKGDWKWLCFDGNNDNSGDGSLMAYTVVEYGGGEGTVNDYANIKCLNSSELLMQNCRVANSNRHGIYLGYYSSLTLTESSIYSNSYSGIYIFYSSTANISGNDIHNNSDYGINVAEDVTTEISGNHIHDNNDCGIRVSYSSTSDINGNNIHGNAEEGIFVYNNSTANISGNDIHNNSTATSQSNYGIRVYNSATANISGNDIYDNSYYGVVIDIGSTADISGNNINNHNYDGVRVLSNSTADISGNDIYHNGDYGIYVYNSSTANINGNDIYLNGGDGIGVYNSSTANIYNTLFWLNSIEKMGEGDVAYNCFWDVGFGGSGFPNAFGIVITVNANGDSSDTWSNLFMDPGFVYNPWENSTWEHYNDYYTLIVGVPLEFYLDKISSWHLYNADGDLVTYNNVQRNVYWDGGYWHSVSFPLTNTECEDCTLKFFISDNFNNWISINLPYQPESTGPELGPILDYDLNLTESSVAIDAGHPDYFDPDGSIKDIGSRYFDQGTTPPAINSITADTLSGNAPLVVHFTADITNPVVERLWSFGDGSTSTSANPVHMYTVPGTYTVTLTINGPNGSDFYTAEDYISVYSNLVVDDALLIPKQFTLHQNYPNPFNPVTTLHYDLPEQSFVSIMIYDILGREIIELVHTVQDAGFKSIQWDATNDAGNPVNAGVYLYQIRAGEFVQTKKMVLLK